MRPDAAAGGAGADLLPDAIRPDWGPLPAPPGVRALMSTRLGGVSVAPFDSLNLRPSGLPGSTVDEPAAVRENQRRFATALAAVPVWLDQVHGDHVLRLRPEHLRPGAPLPRADAAICTEPGIACAVLVADCLPVLLCSRDGRAVGAVHAGWRGLAGGVVDHAVAALCEAAGCAPADLLAWLGPCIGPAAFEVGADVLQAFGADAQASAPAGAGPATLAPADAALFRFSPRSDGSARWRADLAGLARRRLAALQVGQVGGGGWCTVAEASRFFSFRRAPVTGRMAAAIAIAG